MSSRPSSSFSNSYGPRLFQEAFGSRLGSEQPSFIDSIMRCCTSTKLAPDTAHHLMCVYRTIGLLCISLSLSVAFLTPIINHTFAGFALIGALVWFMFWTPTSDIFGFPLSTILLHSIAGLLGVSIGPLVCTALHVAPQLVIMAGISASILFCGCSFIALKAPTTTMLALYSSLLAIVSMISMISFTLMLFGSQLLSTTAYLCLSIIMLTVHTILDVQSIIQRFEQQHDDAYEFHALVLFLNFVRMFGSILRLILKLSQDNDKNKNNRQQQRRTNYNDNNYYRTDGSFDRHYQW